MKVTLSIFVLILAIFEGYAQPYAVKNGNTRHRFAQLEIGLTQYYSSKSGTTQVFDAQGTIRDFQFGSKGTTALYIGGTHFWGHCDLALTIPLFTRGVGMKYAVDLQAKYYPWRIEKNQLRPYVGMSMNPYSYSQNDGPSVSKVYFPFLGGLNYMIGNNQLELGFLYNYAKPFDYALSRTQYGRTQVQPFIFNLTYKLTLETTGNGEKSWRDGTTAKKTKELGDAGKLSNFSIAIGPTSSFKVQNSDYLNTKYPFVGQHSYSSALEYGLGYYFNKSDVVINLAYRRFKSEIEAYGYNQRAARKALSLEAYKFLFDYHGFVPFLGANISYENLEITEKDNSESEVLSTFKGIKPGVTFGWDIRPDKLQKWILRTSLRYYPNLNVTMPNGQKNALDQLEFNFIQLVLYPERFKLKGL